MTETQVADMLAQIRYHDNLREPSYEGLRLISFFITSIRDDVKGPAALAEAYGIPEDTIKKIVASVRAPIIVREANSKDDAGGYAVAK
jgi:hypothetical protein